MLAETAFTYLDAQNLFRISAQRAILSLLFGGD